MLSDGRSGSVRVWQPCRRLCRVCRVCWAVAAGTSLNGDPLHWGNFFQDLRMCVYVYSMLHRSKNALPCLPDSSVAPFPSLKPSPVIPNANQPPPFHLLNKVPALPETTSLESENIAPATGNAADHPLAVQGIEFEVEYQNPISASPLPTLTLSSASTIQGQQTLVSALEGTTTSCCEGRCMRRCAVSDCVTKMSFLMWRGDVEAAGGIGVVCDHAEGGRRVVDLDPRM